MVTEKGRGEINGIKVAFLESDASSETAAIDEIEAYCSNNRLRRCGTYSLEVAFTQGHGKVYRCISEVLA